MTKTRLTGDTDEKMEKTTSQAAREWTQQGEDQVFLRDFFILIQEILTDTNVAAMLSGNCATYCIQWRKGAA